MKSFLKVLGGILVVALLLSGMVSGFVLAEQESLEALLQRRAALLQELAEVNVAIVDAMGVSVPDTANGELGRICDLFPDEIVACAVRDACAKFSIQQTVTQAELDTVRFLELKNYQTYMEKASDLAGVGYLRGLGYLEIDSSNIKELPRELAACRELWGISADYSALEALPDWIDQLSKLQSLNLNYTKIKALPDEIGNLPNLVTIAISHTDVSALPASVGLMPALKNLFIGNTKITELPETIYRLKLDYLDMQGLSIK